LLVAIRSLSDGDDALLVAIRSLSDGDDALLVAIRSLSDGDDVGEGCLTNTDGGGVLRMRKLYILRLLCCRALLLFKKVKISQRYGI